ncbi:TetR/AcrR family transcriptional regulator [Clostridium sp. BJN0013]|uniref:TetR/AcrR family transcriptional regulator n=1 Tax=Clostridium sp. BJN0013 TaxID=3236840 RepID=UPI0034C5D7AD
MNAENKDRRIRRTEKLIKQGLCEMIKKKSLKDITVKDITDVADLNRRTFYLHYKDIYDLLEQIEKNLIKEFKELLENCHPIMFHDSAYRCVEVLLQHVYDNLNLLKVIVTNNTNILDKLMNIAISYALNSSSDIYKDDDENVKYAFVFIIFGTIGIVKKWIDDGTNISPHQMSIMINDFIAHGLTSIRLKKSLL